MSTKPLVIAIDATRNRSGGAVAHMLGLISHADPREHGIEQVHFWAHAALVSKLPARPWLVKHDPTAIGSRLPEELWWQFHTLPQLLARYACDVVFNTDAGSVCPVKNAVTLSQDMLSFEPGEMQRYGLSRGRLRLEILRTVQTRSLQRARAAIFLTEYARRRICSQIGGVKSSVVIPHGIDEVFRTILHKRRPFPSRGPIKVLYVSNTAPYKHQWHVVEAISTLRQRGIDICLRLVGGGKGPAQTRLERSIQRYDPARSFVSQTSFLPHSEIPFALASADLFVFASSCENMPITLLEAMASGIPICASHRGPMPEVLGQGGTYFDPEVPSEIAAAVENMVNDPERRRTSVELSQSRASGFTWPRCASETWRTLAGLAR